MGLEAIVAPLFHLRPVQWEAPDTSEVDSVLLTSANACRLGGDQVAAFADLPCYAVGEATADAARSAGFREVRTGPGNGAAALRMMIADGAERPLHLCARDHLPLGSPRILRRIVYAADAVSALPPAAVGAVRDGAVALVHSPRAASLFAKLVDLAGLDRSGTCLVAISDAAAAPAGFGWRKVATAPRPRDQALLELAAKLCKIGGSDTGKV
jgi:uroporphyrinogen-III synthase